MILHGSCAVKLHATFDLLCGIDMTHRDVAHVEELIRPEQRSRCAKGKLSLL